ncbi:hypothetical protein [Salisediminibacterium halotolerans]|uniref:Uncharacterized protein n=1 Tax=Salisediminibacterium halotolerans TaxID=517425 RepID=A0A1H9UH25_9BACI|nr:MULTISPECIES: hypothetical protein [Salisediminibacterium]RLJ69288.1 hypothetical protein BCL39_2783 [Actinophytocola xinjiangensis]RPE86977.1 hypothetical protein EDD67_1841 [Salisediminibacterium halotolerans]TWG32290.1 hypothetical protein BCL52_2778 [Salisediminibacterium halotolerans]SES08726.1 hypothetical protein SAMN05444126_11445 [Salisediminibacterium haloalkalitolerans]GEL08815.1 hypothetical protein SHA02_22310 [Salisediminibacterium halotolerans]
MNVIKRDVLRMIDELSEEELRILYTFLEEFQIAQAERGAAQTFGTNHDSRL